jgi:hypothetical protein
MSKRKLETKITCDSLVDRINVLRVEKIILLHGFE